MALNLSDIKAEIRAYIRDQFSQPVVEQSVPDSKSVRRVNGAIETYIAFHFGDLQRMYRGGQGFSGTRYNDHELPIYFQSVAPTAEIASATADRVVDVMLGADFKFTGQVRKRPGGGMFPIVESNAATEAYQFPSSFAITVNLLEKE